MYPEATCFDQPSGRYMENLKTLTVPVLSEINDQKFFFLCVAVAGVILDIAHARTYAETAKKLHGDMKEPITLLVWLSAMRYQICLMILH